MQPGEPGHERPGRRDRYIRHRRTTLTATAVGAANVKPRNGLIAFMRPGTVGEYDIWVVRPDGTGLRRLTESPAN